MPHRVWKHHCPVTGGERHHQCPSCDDCHALGAPAGWRYSTYEAMGIYQELYRLKPLGRHRPMADQLLGGLTADCAHCDGTGLYDADGQWAKCGPCRGLGRCFTVHPDRAARIRRLILSEYPDAGAGSFYEQAPYHRTADPRTAADVVPPSDHPGDRFEVPSEYEAVLRALSDGEARCVRCDLARGFFATPYPLTACPGCLADALERLRAGGAVVPAWAEYLEGAARREAGRQRAG